MPRNPYFPPHAAAAETGGCPAGPGPERHVGQDGSPRMASGAAWGIGAAQPAPPPPHCPFREQRPRLRGPATRKIVHGRGMGENAGRIRMFSLISRMGGTGGEPGAGRWSTPGRSGSFGERAYQRERGGTRCGAAAEGIGPAGVSPPRRCPHPGLVRGGDAPGPPRTAARRNLWIVMGGGWGVGLFIPFEPLGSCRAPQTKERFHEMAAESDTGHQE